MDALSPPSLTYSRVLSITICADASFPQQDTGMFSAKAPFIRRIYDVILLHPDPPHPFFRFFFLVYIFVSRQKLCLVCPSTALTAFLLCRKMRFCSVEKTCCTFLHGCHDFSAEGVLILLPCTDTRTFIAADIFFCGDDNSQTCFHRSCSLYCPALSTCCWHAVVIFQAAAKTVEEEQGGAQGRSLQGLRVNRGTQIGPHFVPSSLA